MSAIDGWLERLARGVARRSSRRSFLARLGGTLAGATMIPLLPISRASAQAPAAGDGSRAASPRAQAPPDDSALEGALGDPSSCEYWRHCAIDGFLCSCCGGSADACPPGTEMSPVTWIGTCRNPSDGRDYVISYNDCCGKDFCGRCNCNRNEGEKPIYMPAKNNDINWCMGARSTVYHCSTAIVLGVASEPDH